MLLHCIVPNRRPIIGSTPTRPFPQFGNTAKNEIHQDLIKCELVKQKTVSPRIHTHTYVCTHTYASAMKCCQEPYEGLLGAIRGAGKHKAEALKHVMHKKKR